MLHQETMKTYATPDTKVFVESGLYLGETVEQAVLSGLFERIYSVELSNELANRGRRKFGSIQNVQIIEGDASVVFPGLMERITSRAMFWLDAHWSLGITARGPKNSSIVDELNAIAAHPIKNHTILIDDMRYMTTDPRHFGSTPDELTELIMRINPEYRIEFIIPIKNFGPQVLVATV